MLENDENKNVQWTFFNIDKKVNTLDSKARSFNKIHTQTHITKKERKNACHTL